MGSTAGPRENKAGGVVSMGLERGMVVQELGWDSDVDEGLRSAIMDAIDGDLVYEAVEAVDAVLLWWRDSDGDLADGLMDSLTDLGAQGSVWLLTPKVGRPGYVEATDIAESALTAGLAVANQVRVSPSWQAQKLVRPKANRR